jgi:hypothetical protein
MKRPEPLVIAWRGRRLRVRHDDPRLGPYTPAGARLRAIIELASDAGKVVRLDAASGWTGTAVLTVLIHTLSCDDEDAEPDDDGPRDPCDHRQPSAP